jgi:hypothetical protein
LIIDYVERKRLDDRHGRKSLNNLKADKKVSLSEITIKFNNSENINRSKKQCGGISKVRGIIGLYAGKNTNL